MRAARVLFDGVECVVCDAIECIAMPIPLFPLRAHFVKVVLRSANSARASVQFIPRMARATVD